MKHAHVWLLFYLFKLLADDLHYENEVWFPTGYYAKGGDIITMTFDGPLIKSGAYVQIGQHVIDHISQEGRSRLITQYQNIVQNSQVFTNPWGGPIYITVRLQYTAWYICTILYCI